MQSINELETQLGLVDNIKIQLDDISEFFKIFKKFIEIKEGHPGSILSVFDIVSCLYLGKFINSKKN